jgi:hypothetical protein
MSMRCQLLFVLIICLTLLALGPSGSESRGGAVGGSQDGKQKAREAQDSVGHSAEKKPKPPGAVAPNRLKIKFGRRPES